MNKKASSDLLHNNIIGIIIVSLVFLATLAYIMIQQNGSAIWEEYYTKEIARMINLAEPGDVITLDVHKATEVASSNKVRSQSEIFSFDNQYNEICVKLGTGSKTCYNFIKEVDVTSWDLIPAGIMQGNEVRNILVINIGEFKKPEVKPANE
jgi:hypothetical protein